MSQDLLQDYRLEIFRPECNPSFQSLHCHARLEQDISQVLPYLNQRLGGFGYIDDPPSLTLRVHGRLITLHGRLVAINALKDQAEAEKIMAWLKREVNQTWRERDNIEPSFQSAPRPQLLEVLKSLPRTNCAKCGQPTCMVFAVQLVEGGRGVEQCPELGESEADSLRDYLGPYAG